MKIKICGLRREEDIAIVNKYKPDYAGFIIEYPKSKRSISLDRAISLASLLDKRIKAVAVFVNAPIDQVKEAAEHFDLVQLHGDEDDEYIKRLSSVAETPIIKAFIIKSDEDIERANASSAPLLLLDGGKGDGKPFNWDLLRKAEKPFFLAGGINEGNMHIAIKNINPMALDISSGVETDGFKDETKIKRIMEIIDEYR